MTDDEILEAVRLSLVGRDVPAPATGEKLAEAEGKIGYPMPLLLKRLYMEVANGWVGPHMPTILGTMADPRVDALEDITSLFYEDGPDPGFPLSGLVQVGNWNGAVRSLVDFTDPSGLMWGIDNGAYFRESMTFREWIVMHVEGSLEAPLGRDHPESEYLWEL